MRQREQGLVIHGIGDIFLDAATEFRLAYPNYMGHLPAAEKRLKDELDKNAEFRRFLEVSVQSTTFWVTIKIMTVLILCL